MKRVGIKAQCHWERRLRLSEAHGKSCKCMWIPWHLSLQLRWFLFSVIVEGLNILRLIYKADCENEFSWQVTRQGMVMATLAGVIDPSPAFISL